MRRTVCRLAGLVLGLSAATHGGGCGEDFSTTAFRDAAAASLTEGLTTVMQGLIEGYFAGLKQQDSAPAAGS